MVREGRQRKSRIKIEICNFYNKPNAVIKEDRERERERNH